MKTIQPIEKLSFNDWMIYIYSQIRKPKTK
jgi:hypothetical protein